MSLDKSKHPDHSGDHAASGGFFLLSVLLFQQLLGGLTFPIAKFGLEQIEPLTLLYVALGVSVGAYVLWYWLLKRMEVTRLAVFHNLQPVIASVVAFAFFGEAITGSSVLGGAIVLTGVLITEW